MKTYGTVVKFVAAAAAVAVSGTVVANHNEDHRRGTGPGSKISLSVENHCVPLQPNVDEVSSPTLKVTSTIRNDSEIAFAIPVVVDQKSVIGLQLVKGTTPPKNKSWDQVGGIDWSLTAAPGEDPAEKIQPGASQDYISKIDLCGDSGNPFDANAVGLNAEVKIMIKDSDGNILRSFIGSCDDMEIDDNEDGEDDADESQIDFDDPKYEWLKGYRDCP